MAVTYREVNLQLDGTVNQLPYQPMTFQKLGGQKYFAKVDNLRGYHPLRLEEEISKVQQLSHHGASIASWTVRLKVQQRLVNQYQS